MVFTLKSDRWYACQSLSASAEAPMFFPIKMDAVEPQKTGRSILHIKATGLQAAKPKWKIDWIMKAISRGQDHIIATVDGEQATFLIHPISIQWMRSACPLIVGNNEVSSLDHLCSLLDQLSNWNREPWLIRSFSSILSPITNSQRDLFVRLIDGVVEAVEGVDPLKFDDIPEYENFRQAAYACGFVCEDIDLTEAASVHETMAKDLDQFLEADLKSIRMTTHFMMRHIRNADAGSLPGAGGLVLQENIDSGLLLALRNRLADLHPMD